MGAGGGGDYPVICQSQISSGEIYRPRWGDKSPSFRLQDALRRKWEECRAEGQILLGLEGESSMVIHENIGLSFSPMLLQDTIGKTS